MSISLETRWAIFLSTLGVKHEYKSKGYASYFPTFWLPELDYFMDVSWGKATGRTDLLTRHTGKRVYVFCGDIPVPTLRDDRLPLRSNGEWSGRLWYEMVQEGDNAYVYGWDEEDGEWMDHQQLWCECPICEKVGIVYSGCNERLCQCYGKGADHGSNYASPRLLAAYEAAHNACLAGRR